MDTLDDKIIELIDAIGTAKLELKTVRAQVGRVAMTRSPFAVALDEAGLELKVAEDELGSMVQAQLLLQQLAARLGDADRAILTRTVKLLCACDFVMRAETLVAEAQRLRGLRLEMPGGGN